MIRLTKLDEPPILIANGALWRQEYIDLRNGVEGLPGAAANRYQHPQIRDTLELETVAKCAYCEARLGHVAYIHIEHIFPKSARPDLIVEWTNLTLACPRCNNSKLDYYDEQEPLLNPYLHDPKEHLYFIGPMVLHRPGSDIGLRTVAQLDLSRAELVEDRAERLRHLHNLIELWNSEARPQTKEVLALQIRREASPDQEYSAVVRWYLELVQFPLEVEQAPAEGDLS